MNEYPEQPPVEEPLDPAEPNPLEHLPEGLPVAFAVQQMFANFAVNVAARGVELTGEKEQVERERDEAVNRADIDATSGLLTRYAWKSAVLSSSCRPRRHGDTPVDTIMFLDVDRFKSVNDTLGHAVGDNLIAQVAKSLKASTRGSDLVGRYGGDEFLLYLHGTSLAEAMAYHPKLRRNLGQIRHISAEGQNVLLDEGSVTVSVGAAELPPQADGETLARALSIADRGLYLAKEQGRDRLAIATAEEVAGYTSRQFTFDNGGQ